MGRHFEAISRVQHAVIAGDLPAARRSAEALAKTLTDANHPKDWAAHLAKVRAAVWTVARAEDIEAAAAGTARAAQACGSCHAALGVEVVEGGAQTDVERPADFTEYMQQHLWAADQMWSGLVGPSDAAWTQGSEVLAKAGLVPKGDVDFDREMIRLAATLNTAGKNAMAAVGDERARAYGTFLGACASCHRHHLDKVD